MQESLEASLVRIRTATGRVVGAGFLVGERHILTCAHVISQALDLSDFPVDPPQAAVSLDFPLVPPRTLLTASVVQWCPPLSDGRGDIAGLELQDDPPAGAEVVRFAEAWDVWKHDFRVLGFPEGYDDGVWATGRLLRRQATNWIQIEDVKAQGFAVAPGFSGTPVWDEQLQGVVGMVVAASRPTDLKAAFVLPLDVLVAAWPHLTLPRGEPRNPYKGLRPFTQDDTRDFFGREQVVDKLVDTIAQLLAEQPAATSKRLLTILGPSGSGKSSLVMAGLLPRLQQGALPGSETWIYLEPMVPGKHPLEALILSLAPCFPDRSFTSLREDLEDREARGLHQLAAHVLTTRKGKQPGAKVMLLVDQFEELFTQTESADERERFMQLLLVACSEPNGPLLMLLTLRADFYDRPMGYPELYQVIEAHQVALLSMDTKDLRRVIEQPAALPGVQVTFEGDLVNRLLTDVQGQVGALPLLQFTLDQLFQRRSGRQLTLSAYRELGGVKGALTKQAEEIYAALPSEEHRKLARALFVRLIDPGATEQDTTRRRAALSEFTLADPTQTRLMRETIDAFIAVCLLTTNEIAGTTTIEVSHEALIREWPRLAGWLREAREDIRLQQTISQDATEWEQRNEPGDRLYRGSQLNEAQAWARRNTPSTCEVAFLRASTAQRRRSVVNATAIVLLLVLAIGISVRLLQLLRQSTITLTTVTTLNDSGLGSLRQVLTTARSGDTITFDASLKGGTIVLTSDDLSIITKNLTIQGPGEGILSLGSAGGPSIFVSHDASVTFSGLTFKDDDFVNTGRLTLTNSTLPDSNIRNQGGGTLTLINSTVSGNMSSGNGGGIYNEGTLVITNSTISDNRASNGGGIYNQGGALIITNSTISDNTATRAGGGIYNSGMLTQNNSTVSGNRATDGGGIDNEFGSTLTQNNSTVSGNRANIGGGIAIYDRGRTGATIPFQAMLLYCTVYGNTANVGGGIWVDNIDKKGQVTMEASIVAGNSAHTGPDIAGHLASLGYNLVGDRSGATFLGPLKAQSTDLLGVSWTKLGIDPVLRGNGGSTNPHTLTLALLPGSPAIDAIPLQYCQVKGIFNSRSGMYTDQRGMKRPDDNESACDIGAYESSP